MPLNTQYNETHARARAVVQAATIPGFAHRFPDQIEDAVAVVMKRFSAPRKQPTPQ